MSPIQVIWKNVIQANKKSEMESKNQNSSEIGTTGFTQNKSTLLVTEK